MARRITTPGIPVIDVSRKTPTSKGVYPSMVAAKHCPACGLSNPRRLTKKVLLHSVRTRWLCEACSTVFDVFHGGR